jgi:hypothetical protein
VYGRIDLQEVEERVGGMGIVSTERLQTELSMHEYDSIACLEEVFRRCCTTSTYASYVVRKTMKKCTNLWRTSAKIVKETYSEMDIRSMSYH